ncbi:MAG: hypothetical protein L0387_04635 [Acidobacteria bacterium]|nr:hypothetical protein [Acidobacteriota bacterium]MCI0719177.1 hypothetical protein [Acidobacteriota bacterium]
MKARSASEGLDDTRRLRSGLSSTRLTVQTFIFFTAPFEIYLELSVSHHLQFLHFLSRESAKTAFAGSVAF